MIALPDSPKGWCCYLLVCSDGSYYCGIASNLASRVRHHASGKGSGYTKRLKPVALIWFESHPNRHSAAAHEKQIKSWSHEKKRALAEGGREFEGLGIRMMVSLG